jgi:CxxC motif-containing protein
MEAAVIRELTCITCPFGCDLTIEEGGDGILAIAGNRCARGASYAREEFLDPKRVVTATCKIARSAGDGPRRVPCRSSAAFPRERVSELLRLAYGLEVCLPVKSGQVLIRDALGTGIDLIATRGIG